MMLQSFPMKRDSFLKTIKIVLQNVRKCKDEQVPGRPSAAAESSRAAPPGGSYTPGEGFRMCPRHQEILRTECRG